MIKQVSNASRQSTPTPKLCRLVFLSLFFLTVAFATNAHNFEAINSDGKTIYYNITSSSPATVSVTYYGDSYYDSYSGEYEGVITIPSSVTYNGTTYTVTSIGDRAFQDCSSLSSVDIPSSVTSIGNGVFSGCSSLTSVDIPTSVTSIGQYAFSGCSSLTSVDIPTSVTSIDFRAFYKVRNINYHGIATEAPWGALSINGYVDGYLVYSDSTKTTLLGCSAVATSVTIPTTVTSIGEYAFENCSRLTTIDIPSNLSLTSIGEYTFYGCSSLTSVEIPSSVTTIGNSAFYGCHSLASVEIPTSVTSIGFAAFSDCRSLTSVEIPSSVFSIGSRAFYKVRNVNYYGVATGAPWGALSMNGYVDGYFVYSDSTKTNLLGCSAAATSVTIPTTVTSIGEYAFENCSRLITIDIPSNLSLTSIGEYTFYGCSSLTSVEIPSSVTSIGVFAFYGCHSLASVEIPSSVTSIGMSAFERCHSLASVEIPSSVTWIGLCAFSACTMLDTVVFSAMCEWSEALFRDCNISHLTITQNFPPSIYSYSDGTDIAGISNSTQIYVPCESIAAYRSHSIWGQYSNYHAISISAYDTLSACGAFTWRDGITYTTDTVVTYAVPDSICDSVVTLNLTVHPTYQHVDALTMCDDMLPYSYGDSDLTTAGVHTIGFSTINNCDSVITLNLMVNPTYQHVDSVALCDNMFPYSYGDSVLNVAGVYTIGFTSISNCDSVITLGLMVNPTYQYTDSLVLCDNMLPYSYGDSVLNVAGEYTIGFNTMNNCDSVITLGLTINPTYEGEDYRVLCQSALPMTYGDSVFDETTTSGNYAVMMTSQQGCDSLIMLGLNVHESEETQLHMVTVENNLCKVAWQKQAAVERYNIYREGTGVNPFDLVVTVPFDAAPYWIDSTTNPKSRLYRYKITSVDSCGVESSLSESHATIHLMISDGVENSHNLTWNPYEGAAYTYYRIYRGRQEHNQVLIDSVPASYTSYSDYEDPSAHVFYSVAAVLVDGEAKSVVEVRSNTASPDEVGIEEIIANEQHWHLQAERGALLVQGAEGEALHIYDAYGRLLKQIDRAAVTERYEVPAAGLYIVKRQGGESKKITVLK